MALKLTEGEARVDNQNTNQNEALTPESVNVLLKPDTIQDPPFAASSTDTNLAPMSSPTVNPDQQASDTIEFEKMYNGPIPTIEITQPDEGSGDNAENKVDLDCPTVSSTMDYLRPPAQDTTINIARPKVEENVNVSRLVDNANDEDVKVICRYSSTPVLSTPKSRHSMDSEDVSMLSISSASPIAPVDMPTPCGKHSETSHDNTSQDINDLSDASQEMKSPNKVDRQNAFRKVSSDGRLRNTDGHKFRGPLFNDTRNILQTAQDSQYAVSDGKVSSEPQDQLHTQTYAGAHSSYYPCMPTQTACDYHLGRASSWTDLSYRPDLSPAPMPSAAMTDPCCLGINGCMDTEYFVYPSIYVSSAGLISVLLRNDISVEMTVDRTIRVVSHNHMMAVATDSRGTAACLYHPAVKVFQMGTTTDIATQGFRAQMGGNDTIIFSNGVNYFRLEGAELQPTGPVKFTDIMRDQSVNLLFSSEGYGESLVASCMQVAAQAEYSNLPKGGVIIRINGVKVTQTGSGDVTVVTGAKFIRLSPNNGTTRLGNRFVDMEVEKDWSVRLTRGSHSFIYARKRAMICNGKMEAGFDEKNALKVTNLLPRHPLLAEPTMVRRPARKPLRPSPVPSPVPCTHRRRPGPPTGFGGRGGVMGSI